MARRRRTTSRQRAASRRNLAKARAARARRRGWGRSKSKRTQTKSAALLIAVVLIVVTHGVVLVPIVGVALIYGAARNRAIFHSMARPGGLLRERALTKKERLARLQRATQIAPMLAMTPREFELLVASILREQHYSNVSVTGGPGDLSVDISAVNPDGDKAVVQCKRYAPEHRVGSRDVQSFIGMAFQHHAAKELIFATTSTFTEPAQNLARQHQIKLWDGDQLIKLATQILSPESDTESDTAAE